jgi:fibronectin-binding autotransporter adhesin
MRRPALFVCLTALISGSPLWATISVSNWTGKTNSSIGTSSNWDTSPGNSGSTSASLVFGTGATYTSVNVSALYSSHGLSFSAGSTSYSVTGNGPSASILDVDAGGITASSPALLDSTVTLQLTNAQLTTPFQTWDVSSTLTVASPITGSVGIDKTDTGTLILSGNNSFSGGLKLAGGTLRINNNNAAGAGTLTLSDSTVLGTGTSTTSFTLGNAVTLGNNVTLNDSSSTSQLHFGGQVTLANASTTAQLGAGSNAVFFEGGLNAANSNSILDFSSSSTPGIVIVTATTSSNISEIDSSNSGVIFLSPSALPHSKIQSSLSGYVGMADGFNNTSGHTPSELLNLVTDKTNFSGVIGFDTKPGSSTNDFTGTSSNPIDLSLFTGSSFAGLGTLTSAAIDGEAVIKPPSSGPNAGVLELSAIVSSQQGATLTVSAPLLSANGISSVRIGATSTESANYKDFTGTVVLTNSLNDYTGGTQIDSGTLLVGDNAALGTGTISTPTNSYYPVLGATTSSFTLTNNFNLEGPGLVVGVNTTPGTQVGNALTLAGNISGPGILDVRDATTLGGTNTVGGLAVNEGASLTLATNAPASSTGTFDVQWGSVAFTAAGSAAVIGTLSGTTSGSITLAPAVGASLTVDQTSDAHYYGTINQNSVDFTGSLIKTGTARLFLDGANVYSGTTTISGGALIADNANAFGTSSIVLDGGMLGVANGVTLTRPITFTANGGMLGGSGTLAPASGLTIGSNVIIAPGSTSSIAPGTLTFGTSGLTLASGGAIHWQITSVGNNLPSDAGKFFDTVVVNGPVSIGAMSGTLFTIKPISLDGSGSSAVVGDFNAGTSYSWLLLSASGGITNFNAADFTFDTSAFLNSLNGGAFGLSLGGTGNNELFLNFTPVPEPSEWLLMAVGLAGLLLVSSVRRRRAHRRRMPA